MPFIRITVGAQALPEAHTRTLAVEATRLVVEILGKRREVTAVSVGLRTPAGWYVGGEAVAASSFTAAHAEIFITAGTNGSEKKAAMIEAMNALLRDVLGPTPEATYVVIHELAASDWGYDGRTQASRRSAVPTL
jgi:4-oxalocrotonate tautomerase